MTAFTSIHRADAAPRPRGSLPPGPRLPAVVQGALFVLRPLPFFERCRARYGPTFSLRVPTLPPVVVVSDEAAIRDLFACRPDDVSVGAALDWMHPFVGRGSLLLRDGEAHRRERRLLMPPFHHARMRGHARAMGAIARRAMSAWPVDRAFAIEPAARAITLEIILQTVFGVTDAEAEGLRAALTALFEDFSVLNLIPALRVELGGRTPWGRYVRHRAALDRELFRLIRARREERARGAGGERGDVLTMLVDARYEDGGAMGDEDLRDELVTLVSAGHETSTSALAWVFQCLAHHPEAQARARREVEGASEDAADLPWVDAVVQETLRRHAVFPLIARVLRRRLTLGGWDLAEGTLVYVSIHLTHRNPELWPRPERFEPERFLDARPRPFAYVPFGGGGRRCLGMAYARLELRGIVAEALRRFVVRPAGPPEAAASRGFTLAPAKGAVVRLQPNRGGLRVHG